MALSNPASTDVRGDCPSDDRLAAVVLESLARDYPWRPDLLLQSPEGWVEPRIRHPLFHTSYDWHSCVHMHWSLARLLRRGALPAPQAARASAWFEARFTPAAVAGECAFVDRPGQGTFERPYGQAWLLALQAELRRLATAQPAAAGWAAMLEPLAVRFAGSLSTWLRALDWPVRAGTHGNTAFACVLALDWARERGQRAFAAEIAGFAARAYGQDRRYPAAYEPSGEDFLPAGLVEAVLMRAVLGPAQWSEWWAGFSPEPGAIDRWLEPVRVSTDTDARIVHLHGLNLARAWCWQQLLPALPPERNGPVRAAIAAHRAASMGAAGEGDYVGTHWLASFALLADGGLGGPGGVGRP
ncbi:MAG: DUF2891 family protein [Pseudomonadota bacterium]|jgi:hypothetical protein